jgi:hypothetical protein
MIYPRATILALLALLGATGLAQNQRPPLQVPT